MLGSTNFWVGVVVGFFLYWGWMRMQAKHSQ